jgi:proteasome accessory factor A
MAGAGQIDAVPADDLIERFVAEPPDDTRAYLRAHVLRKFGPLVAEMDWGYLRFRVYDGGLWYSEARLDMPDPRLLNREQCESVVRGAKTLDDLFNGLTSEVSNSCPVNEENDDGTRTTQPRSA